MVTVPLSFHFHTVGLLFVAEMFPYIGYFMDLLFLLWFLVITFTVCCMRAATCVLAREC